MHLTISPSHCDNGLDALACLYEYISEALLCPDLYYIQPRGHSGLKKEHTWRFGRTLFARLPTNITDARRKLEYVLSTSIDWAVIPSDCQMRAGNNAISLHDNADIEQSQRQGSKRHAAIAETLCKSRAERLPHSPSPSPPSSNLQNPRKAQKPLNMAGSDETTLLVFQHSYQSPGQSDISTMISSALQSLLASRGPRTVHTTLPLDGDATVTVRQADLLTPSERETFGHLPNMRNVIATVRIPWRLRVGRRWDVLHVVSERAPGA